MFSRTLLAKQAPTPKAAAQTKSAQIKQAQTYFAQNETELASPQFAYSLAGVRTFAEGEPNEGPEGYFVNRRLPFPIQAKLTVGAVNDPLETEADRVADQVMRMPAPVSQSFDQEPGGSVPKPSTDANRLQRKCDCGGTCDDCKPKDKSDKHDEHAKVQMKAAGPGATGGFAAPPIVHEVLRSSGQPLDKATRKYMEPRFGHDFSKVRVHTDAKAAESAEAIGAKAYTVGNNVVFGTGEYGTTQTSQRLLGHELTHVVQQRLLAISRVQCSPDPAVPNPDANEASARAAGATLPIIDRTTLKSNENEAAAQAIVLTAFGGEDGVNAVFEQLSPIVKTMVDKYVVADEDHAKLPHVGDDHIARVTANRVQFLGRMRLYFNSWKEVIDHFSAIEAVDKKFKTVQMYLHRDARVRFERAAAVLLSKGHSIPEIGEGFSIRGFHRGKIQHKGFMIHAMGYAFDVNAKENPKLANYGTEAGLEKHDPNQVAVTVGSARGQMSLGAPQQASAFIMAMGRRTADKETLAADDRDPDTIKFFKLFEEQFAQMQAGSLGFTQKISSKNRDELLKLRDDYLQVLKKLDEEKKKIAEDKKRTAEERKKMPKGDPKVVEQLEAERRRLLSRIPALVTEWIAAIKTDIADVFKKHPGMDKLRPPSDISHDLKNKAAEIATATKNLSLATTTKSNADVRLHTADQQVAQAKQALIDQAKAEARDRIAPSHDPDWGPERQSTRKLRERRERLEATLFDNVEKLVRAEDAVESATNDLNNIQEALKKATTSRDSFKAELEKSDTKEFRGAWSWVASLKELSHALSAPDFSTDAGVKAFERLTTGDLKELGRDAPVENPPLLRLLKTGFFNPRGAFDLAFFEEMAHSGFFPGAAWPLGGTDPMHFELIEGRRFLQTPGKDMSNF